MSEIASGQSRYFLSYSGVKLPLKLVRPLSEAEVENRNTYYRCFYNDLEQMVSCQKIVYGEVEQEHRYEYYADGVLKRAEIIEGEDDVNVINFDERGLPIR